MTNAQVYTITAICIYAIAMALIGCISYGKSKTLDGFLIGGRNIGAWVTAFAYGTTYFSAVVFVGYAGQHGWNIGIGAIWIGIGNAVLGCMLSWILFANRTRKMTKMTTLCSLNLLRRKTLSCLAAPFQVWLRLVIKNMVAVKTWPSSTH